MIIKIAICDDQDFSCKDLYEKLKIIDMLNNSYIHTFTDKTVFVKKMKENKYDIVFMDINLGENKSGFDIVSTIKSCNPSCLIIYFSSYDSYFRDMAKAEPFYFLQKPVDQKELYMVIKNATKRIYLSTHHYTYEYTFKGVQHKINLNKVLYFESDHRIVKGYLSNGELIEFYKKLDTLESEIKEIHDYFIRPSKSYLINCYYFNKISKNNVLIGNKEFKISPIFKKQFNLQYDRIRETYDIF